MANELVDPLVAEFRIRFEEALATHGTFVSRYEKQEKAYRGILERKADKWRHSLHPPYAFNLIETVVSNTVEMGLVFDVKPSPQVNLPLEEATLALDTAKSIEDLLRHEHRVDEMDYKQRPLYLSAAICGWGIGKSYWNYRESETKKQGYGMTPVYDAQENVVAHVPTVQEIQSKGIVRDHSTFEVIDPRDFIMHESARALQPWEPGGCQYLFNRCWYSYEQLKMGEAAGYYQNVSELKDFERDYQAEYNDRESQVFKVNRTKDLIEVVEYWRLEDGVIKRTIFANRSVVIRATENNPFWHGNYPFVICSTMPQNWTTRGVGDMELIQDLQEMLWETSNQSLDNLELINNFITLIRSDLDDPDAFPYFPGARWPVDGDVNTAVAALQPPYQLADVSMQREALLKGDLQNVTAAAPFASGTETQSVEQKTATGASLVMNAAQQRLAFKKYQAQQGLKQEANMRIKNCQQFITDDRLIHILGPDGASLFRKLTPLEIQGEFVAELRPYGESTIRQEKRAEATQLAQTLIAMAPAMAATGVPFNLKEVAIDFLKTWGKDDYERYFSQEPQPGLDPGAGQNVSPGSPGQAAPGQLQPNLGVTAGSAVDASKPSAAGGMSGSPVVALQRALAMGGGVRNALGLTKALKGLGGR